MSVTVTYGVDLLETDVVGKTVGEYRSMFQWLLNISPDAPSKIDGDSATETSVVSDGSELEFVKSIGQKGSRGLT